MNRPLYTGDAAIKLLVDPTLGNQSEIEKLRGHLRRALQYTDTPDGMTEEMLREAAAQARRIARKATEIAKRVEDARALANEGFTR